jgi:hypothetical protein
MAVEALGEALSGRWRGAGLWHGASVAVRTALRRGLLVSAPIAGIGFGDTGLHARSGVSIVASRKPIAMPAMGQ